MGRLHEEFVIDRRGDKRAVILPLEDYKNLMEDIHDLSVIAERKSESTLSLTEVKKRLKADGLL